MTIPRFLRLGPKDPSPKTAPPASKGKTRLQQFLARSRPSLSRRTGARLVSLHIAQAHAGTGRNLDLDWR